ncbi:alginate lyase family protein [Lacibacterium aquatile]|uniref:Alginate lyase family protein n=1 Tax=Lacibacterium aquatile TaxID=1168082 RepID=A0ABW5DNH0_9PROT
MRLGRALTALVALALTTGASLAEPLRGPVDVAARRVAAGRPAGLYVCPNAPPPIGEVRSVDYFTDPARSIIDKDALERHRALVKPMEDAARSLQAMAESYVKSAPVMSDIAQCATDWLAGWAEADALLGQPDSQAAQHLRATLTAALALPWSVLREDRGIQSSRRRAVDGWFRALGMEVRDDYIDADAGEPGEKGGAWPVAAAALTAAVADDRALFEWSIGALEKEAARIRPDGTLAEEMTRKARARYAHLGTMTAMLLVETVMNRNGRSLSSTELASLERLKDLLVVSYRDGNPIEKMTKVKQVWPGKDGAWLNCWAEIWQSRRPDPKLATLMAPDGRPIKWTWCGGDASLYFGPVATQ